ncbi:hypothetical protein CCH79_00001897 [Gambusia affinis]|uniref:Uncharacterized protein n=1 Tax=Gambusia affinis TaxID=33528 RepID=A0A315VGR6_GAMAF|nr:hypothetical protein CCH79_00001897 [Gambusia affinis]
MMILYSSLPSSMMCRSASSDGMLARMALRHTGGVHLMQFEGHSDSWRHNSIQQVHVRKHPLVPGRRDAEISFEERMQAVEERLQTVTTCCEMLCPELFFPGYKGQNTAFLSSCRVGSNRLAPAVAVLNPVENILGGGHFPGQPALSKRSVEGQHLRQMTWFAAAAAFVLLHPLCDGLYLPLLTVRTWAVRNSVEVIRRQDEAVARAVVAPATEQQVATQAVLQRARQVLVENRVQVVVVGAFGGGKEEMLTTRAITQNNTVSCKTVHTPGLFDA